MIYTLGEHSPELLGSEHWIAPSADVMGMVRLHEQVSVWFNTVIRGDQDLVEVGAGTNIQDGSVLHTDQGIKLSVGEKVTVGHKVMLHGCSIGSGSLIGIGSIVLNGARLGEKSMLGANSLVTEGKEFPDGVLILGAPAKVVRELTEPEMKMIELSALHYMENARRFSDSLRAV